MLPMLKKNAKKSDQIVLFSSKTAILNITGNLFKYVNLLRLLVKVLLSIILNKLPARPCSLDIGVQDVGKAGWDPV